MMINLELLKMAKKERVPGGTAFTVIQENAGSPLKITDGVFTLKRECPFCKTVTKINGTSEKFLFYGHCKSCKAIFSEKKVTYIVKGKGKAK